MVYVVTVCDGLKFSYPAEALAASGHYDFHSMKVCNLSECAVAMNGINVDTDAWKCLGGGSESFPRSKKDAMFFVYSIDDDKINHPRSPLCWWNVKDGRWDFSQHEKDVYGHLKTMFSNESWTAEDPSIRKLSNIVSTDELTGDKLTGLICQKRNWDM